MTASTPRIAFLSRRAYGDVPLSQAPPAIRALRQLEADQKLLVGPNILPDLLPTFPDELQGSCRGLVCRPNWGGKGKLTEDLINRLRVPNQPFVIATLSAGRDHIAGGRPLPNGVDVITSEGANSEQTAELTVFLAAGLLRRALHPALNMGFGVFGRPDVLMTRSLVGVTWAVVGPGRVACAVLRRAQAMGASTLVAYYRTRNVALETAIRTENDLHNFTLTGDLLEAVREADVITIHLPHTPATAGMFDAQVFAAVKSSAVIINMGRHEVVNEHDLLNALAERRFAGFAADVLPEDAESIGSHPHSPAVPLWKRACWSLLSSIETCTNVSHSFNGTALAEKFDTPHPLSERNLVLTPHIGAHTRDSEEAVARDVVAQLLSRLGVVT